MGRARQEGRAQGAGGGGLTFRENATERGGLKERFRVGIGTWGLGTRGEGGKATAVDLTSNCMLCSEKAGMWLKEGMKML